MVATRTPGRTRRPRPVTDALVRDYHALGRRLHAAATPAPERAALRVRLDAVVRQLAGRETW